MRLRSLLAVLGLCIIAGDQTTVATQAPAPERALIDELVLANRMLASAAPVATKTLDPRAGYSRSWELWKNTIPVN